MQRNFWAATSLVLGALAFTSGIAVPAGAQEQGKPVRIDKPAPAGGEKQDKPAPADEKKKTGETPAPGGGPNPRAIANRMAAAVKVHEVRFARLDAVLAVFREKGETDKVARTEALIAREETRYTTELAGFKQELGDETYKKVLASLRATKKGAGKDGKGKEGQPPKTEKEGQPPKAGEKPAEHEKGGQEKGGAKKEGEKKDGGTPARGKDEKGKEEKKEGGR